MALLHFPHSATVQETGSTPGRPTSQISAKDFNRAVELLARQFFLLSGENGKPEADTRSTPQDVFAKIATQDGVLAKRLNLSVISSKVGSSNKKGKLTAKVDKFFESLDCSLHNQQLRQLTKEISKITYGTFPTAASFLLRAIVELSLTYAVTKAGLLSDLNKEFQARSLSLAHKEATLDFLVAFCQKHQSEIFSSKSPFRVLATWRHTKDTLDLTNYPWKMAPSELGDFRASCQPCPTSDYTHFRWQRS